MYIFWLLHLASVLVVPYFVCCSCWCSISLCDLFFCFFDIIHSLWWVLKVINTITDQLVSSLKFTLIIYIVIYLVIAIARTRFSSLLEFFNQWIGLVNCVLCMAQELHCRCDSIYCIKWAFHLDILSCQLLFYSWLYWVVVG